MSAEEQLGRFEAVTDSSLAHLSVEDLLGELLDRVRDLLRVDTAAVLLLDASGSYLVATASRGLEDEVRQGTRVPVRRGFVGRIAAEKQPVVVEQVEHSDVFNPVLRHVGIRSLLGVPLLHQGAVIGVLHVGALETRRFTPEDVDLLQTVADRVALAVQSRTSQTERTAARVLQRSLLPSRLPAVPGLSLAARYVSGGEGSVGGDWYDVFTLPTGRLAVAIGDVVGHGLDAAAAMGRLRSSLRAYALEDDDPSEAMTRLHHKLQHFEPGEMATLLYGVFDPSLERVRLSSAGHPPAILVAPDEVPVEVDVPPGPPLGAPLANPYRTATVHVPAGGLLCLYTDGLVERRDAPIDQGLARLREAIFVGDAEEVCAAVMYTLVGSTPPEDDIALLVAKRDPA